jgi:hypothetical protein
MPGPAAAYSHLLLDDLRVACTELGLKPEGTTKQVGGAGARGCGAGRGRSADAASHSVYVCAICAGASAARHVHARQSCTVVLWPRHAAMCRHSCICTPVALYNVVYQWSDFVVAVPMKVQCTAAVKLLLRRAVAFSTCTLFCRPRVLSVIQKP